MLDLSDVSREFAAGLQQSALYEVFKSGIVSVKLYSAASLEYLIRNDFKQYIVATYDDQPKTYHEWFGEIKKNVGIFVPVNLGAQVNFSISKSLIANLVYNYSWVLFEDVYHYRNNNIVGLGIQYSLSRDR